MHSKFKDFTDFCDISEFFYLMCLLVDVDVCQGGSSLVLQ